MTPLRRETDQSVETPFPVDPPQSNSDQLHSLFYGYPRTNGSSPFTTQGIYDAPKEEVGFHMGDGSSCEQLLYEPF